jgi:hypothetical protein
VAALRRPDDNPTECFSPALSWEDLTDLEPRLEQIERDVLFHASRSRSGAPYCANRFWYGYLGLGFKDRLCAVVGWESDRRTTLRSSEAYDVAYDHLYALLPDCRHGGFCA